MRQREVKQSHDTRGPDPWIWSAVGRQDLIYGRALSGHAGTYRGGMGSALTGGRNFSGDCGPLQNFRRGRFVGASHTVRGSINAMQAFPSTASPAGAALNPNLNSILANGSY
jgi:hypothetical protein